MRKQPGRWLRDRLNEQRQKLREDHDRQRQRKVDGGLVTVAGAGWICGASLVWLIGPSLGWTAWILILPGFAMVVASWRRATRSYRATSVRWKAAHMQKGAQAEEDIGGAIEYALTRPNCAVAHNVQNIGRFGDIDHLVVTTRGLWVIETKSARVDPQHFPRVLERIADNVDAVRNWAPGVRVTGCLVFADDTGIPRKGRYYSPHGEPVRCFRNAKAMVAALAKEAQAGNGNRTLVRRVWQLAKGDATEQPDEVVHQ